jgi:SAM-dependent methyltransferase
MSEQPLATVDRRRVFGETAGATERIAPGHFDRRTVREHQARYRWAARWVRGRTVLDVACGTGYGSALLLGAGARRVVSIDLSEPALGFARRAYPGPCYVQADAGALPLAQPVFDVAVALETIEHLADPLTFLGALGGLVRPGGWLLVSTPNDEHDHAPNPYHLRELSVAELRGGLVAAGFEVDGTWGQQWMPPPRQSIWRRARGLGRLAYWIRSAPTIWNVPSALGFEPLYWCVRARRGGAPVR